MARNGWAIHIGSEKSEKSENITNNNNCSAVSDNYNNNNSIKVEDNNHCNHKVEQPCKNDKDTLEKDDNYLKYRQLLNYEDAPKYLQFNPFIRKGYRTSLPSNLCWESIFWWTNETINIWSHIFGLFLFLGLTINDIAFLRIHAAFVDKIIVGALLCCFQMCMVLSSFYHIFCCRSEKHYECFLTYDLFGIALSLLGIYISGIYYAFWCHTVLRNFYCTTIGVIFLISMIIQIPKLNIKDNIKITVFVSWAAFGVIPTLHWYLEQGGNENLMVQLFIPRVIGMYILVTIAFLIYITKIPERWFVGKVDFAGHSHNWWHIFVLIAFYYWHNSGMKYVEYRMNYGCSSGII